MALVCPGAVLSFGGVWTPWSSRRHGLVSLWAAACCGAAGAAAAFAAPTFCAVYLGAVQIKVHTHIHGVCRGVFCNTAIESANADKVRVTGMRVRAGSLSAK